MADSAPSLAAPSPTLRLLLPTGWTHLGPGRYEVGRSASCQIVLDGAKVSRLHAQIHVGGRDVTIEDLGSANGLYLNGRRVTGGRFRLCEGDTIGVGEFQITVSLEAGPVPDESGAIVVRSVAPSEPGSGAQTSSDRSFALVASVAERILGAGDARRAEELLSAKLRSALDAAKQGERIEPSALDDALRLSLGLARALQSLGWLDYAYELLSLVGRVPSERQADDLERTHTSLAHAGTRGLLQYLEVLRGLPTSMDKLRAVPRLEQLLDERRGRSSRG